MANEQMTAEARGSVPPSEVGGLEPPAGEASEMVALTLELTPACLERLYEVLNKHNAPIMASPGPISLLKWLHLHLRELAVQEELMEAAERFQRQAQTDAAAALKAEKARLMSLV